MITHRLAMLGPVSHVAVMNEGRLVEFGDRDEVLKRHVVKSNAGKPDKADKPGTGHEAQSYRHGRPSPSNALPELWSDDEAPETRQFARAKRVLAIGGGLLLVLFLLAAVVPVGGAVIASGQVGVETFVKRISNSDGGTIAAILVKNGQTVRQGQLLMRLQDTVPGAEAQYSDLTVEQLLAERARLTAEQSGAGRVVFPPALLSAGTPTAAQAMADELKLFTTRQGEQAQMHAQLEARIAQYAENRGYQAQIASLQKQSALIKPRARRRPPAVGAEAGHDQPAQRPGADGGRPRGEYRFAAGATSPGPRPISAKRASK